MRTYQFEEYTVDAVKTLMTYKVLHEFIHVADPINQCTSIPSETSFCAGDCSLMLISNSK